MSEGISEPFPAEHFPKLGSGDEAKAKYKIIEEFDIYLGKGYHTALCTCEDYGQKSIRIYRWRYKSWQNPPAWKVVAEGQGVDHWDWSLLQEQYKILKERF